MDTISQDQRARRQKVARRIGTAIAATFVVLGPTFFDWYRALTGEDFEFQGQRIAVGASMTARMVMWVMQLSAFALLVYIARTTWRQKDLPILEHRRLRELEDTSAEQVVTIRQLQASNNQLALFKEGRRGWEDEREKLVAERDNARERVGALEALIGVENAGRETLLSEYRAIIEKMAGDCVRLEESETSLRDEVARLDAIVNPPPPESDLSPEERAVAFNELSKMLKIVERLNEPTMNMLATAADLMRTKQGIIGDDLSRFVADRLGPPSWRCVGELRDALTQRVSAESAQDAMVCYLGTYQAAREWIVKVAGYGDIRVAELPGYSDWYAEDAELWRLVGAVNDTGSLRRMEDRLRGSKPHAMPLPASGS